MTVPLPARALPLALALAAALACAGRGTSREPFSLVSLDEVQKMLAEPDVTIVDANTRETFEKNHLPGARYYKAAPFAEVLPPDKDRRIVFYCASPS